MPRKLSSKQVRYLWAVGYFKKHSKVREEEISSKAVKRKSWGEEQSDFTFATSFERSGPANEWAEKNLTSAHTLPPHQREAFQIYQSGQYQNINEGLRQNSLEDQPILRQAVKHIHEAIESSKPSKEEFLEFRGVTGDFAADLVSRHQRGELIGSTLQDRGFASMSLSRDTGRSYASSNLDSDGVLLEVRVPKGTRGVYLNGRLQHSDSPYETEYLTKSGTKFKVIDVLKNNEPMWERIRHTIIVEVQNG